MRGAVMGCLVLSLCLAGCSTADSILPYGRELEDMALMEGMGVDGDGDTTYQVTLSTGATQGENGESTTLVLTGEGESVASGCEEIQGLGSAYVYYGHVEQLLIGEELATSGIDGVLGYIQGDVEMRLDTYLYILKEGTAQEAMETLAEKGTSVPDRLEAMVGDSTLIPTFTPVTVREVLTHTNRSGTVAVPALSLTEDGTLVSDGFAILKEGALVGYLSERASQGLDLLTGEVYREVVDLQGTTLRLVDATTKITPNFQEGTLLGLTITTKAEANISQMGDSNLTQEELEQALAQELQGRIWAALEESVALEADFLELQLQSAIASPWHSDTINTQWNWENLILNVEVDADITHSDDTVTK